MQQREAHAGKAGAQFVVQLGDAHERALFVALDLGADEVALVALRRFLPDICEHIVVLAGRDDARDDGRAFGGLVFYLGDVEVAVKDEGEGARDGRCGP